MEDGEFYDVEEEHGSGLLQYGNIDGGDTGSCASSSGGGSFDLSLEPLQRGRANTWHGRARDDTSGPDEEHCSTPTTSVDSTGDPGETGLAGFNGYDADCSTASAAARKATSRRNAWGNLSYADLITKAIESSPDKRLTLSQIYAWMVTNVPFFRDKGESNSSAGWKNSIRHNLSLHNRFMRVQNEGTGKSSWWVLNPDATHTVKTPRRPRALTMDSKSYERQRRGRGAIGQPLGRQLSSRGGILPPGVDPSELTPPPPLHCDPIDPFQMEYRVRAGSFGGRLSPPLETVQEPDISDSSDVCRFTPIMSGYGDGNETLSETLADIFAGDLKMSSGDLGVPANDMMSSVSRPYCESVNEMDYFQPLDVYQPQQMQRSPQPSYAGGRLPAAESSAFSSCMSPGYPSSCRNAMDCGRNGGMGLAEHGSGGMMMGGNMRSRVASFGSMTSSQPQLGYHTMSLTELQDVKPAIHPPQQMSCMFQNNQSTNQQSGPWFGPQSGPGPAAVSSSQGQPARPGPHPRLSQAVIARILAERPHLMAKMQQLIKMKREQLAAQLQQHQMFNSPPMHPRTSSSSSSSQNFPVSQPPSYSSTVTSSMPSPAAEAMSTTPPSSSLFPTDLDLNGLDFSSVDMDCDIDQVISHEIALDGKLDFMFDGLTAPGSVSN